MCAVRERAGEFRWVQVSSASLIWPAVLPLVSEKNTKTHKLPFVSDSGEQNHSQSGSEQKDRMSGGRWLAVGSPPPHQVKEPLPVWWLIITPASNTPSVYFPSVAPDSDSGFIFNPSASRRATRRPANCVFGPRMFFPSTLCGERAGSEVSGAAG